MYKRTMNNIFRISLGATLMLLSACTTSRETLLEKDTVYTKTINRNYAQLGRCIKDQLPMPRTTSNMTPVFVNGMIINTPNSETYGTEVYDDIAAKTYYINDFLKAGLNNFKNWIIVVKSINDKDTKSEVQIKSKMTIWGKPRISADWVDAKVKNCIK